jgi:hypothetical protein
MSEYQPQRRTATSAPQRSSSRHGAVAICLLFLALTIAPAHAQHSHRARAGEYPMPPLPISHTAYYNRMPSAWPWAVPYPEKVTRVMHNGSRVYAFTWSGVQLWKGLPSVEKKRYKNVIGMEMYYDRLLTSAMS